MIAAVDGCVCGGGRFGEKYGEGGLFSATVRFLHVASVDHFFPFATRLQS